MSFSFTLFADEIESTVKDTVDKKIADMPPGDGKDEAEMMAAVTADAIAQLSRGEVEFASAYVTGNITEFTGQINVNVSFAKKAGEPESTEPKDS